MDIERLSRELGFDRETTLRLLDSFVKSTEKDLAQLESAVAAGDAAGAGRAAHHIKGAAANLELAEIAEAAKAVEAAARAGGTAGLGGEAARIRSGFAALKAALG
jgi:HPt (histidine-containing phosphotransfer) domain-containing protein